MIITMVLMGGGDDDDDGGADDDDLFPRSSCARHLAVAPIVTHFWWQVRRSMCSGPAAQGRQKLFPRRLF